MPQTLLALAGLLVFSSYALSRHQADNDVELRSIASEAELAASDLAEDYMARVLQLAWDEADITSPTPRSAPLPPPARLGPDPDPSTGGVEAYDAGYDDIDDYADGEVRRESASIGVDGRLAFAVSVDVVYVNPSAPDSVSNDPTLAKLVTVSAEEVGAAGGRRARVRLQRVVTPVGHAAHR